MNVSYTVRSIRLPHGEDAFAILELPAGVPVHYGSDALASVRLAVRASTLRGIAYDIVRVYHDAEDIFERRLDDLLLDASWVPDTLDLRRLGQRLEMDKSGKIGSTGSIRGRYRAAEKLLEEGLKSRGDQRLNVAVAELRRLRQSSLRCAVDRPATGRQGGAHFTDEELRGIARACCPLKDALAEGHIRFPDSNIFAPDLQLRNWTYIQAFRETGARRGEIASLRVERVSGDAEEQIDIARMHDDSDDLRRPRPATKTAERAVPVTAGLMMGLKALIRQNIAKYGPCNYAFISRRGRPLSLSACDNVIQRLSAATGVKFSAHDFRRTHAHRLYTCILREKGVVGEKDMMTLCALYGWSNSSSAEPYLRHAREEERLAFFRRRLGAVSGERRAA